MRGSSDAELGLNVGACAGRCGLLQHQTQLLLRKPCMHACSVASVMSGFATLWTRARQAPLSMGYPRQEYWIGLPCPPPGDLPDLGIRTMSPLAPALQADSLLLSRWGSPRKPWKDLFESKLCTLKSDEPLGGGENLGRVLAALRSRSRGEQGRGKQSPLLTSADLKRQPAG